MYLFNKQEQLINVKGEHDFTEIHLVEKINTASQLTFSVVNPIAQNIQKVCVPAPRGAGFLMFKIITEDIKNDHIEYTCVESAYDELASYGYIRDLRPSSRSAEYILKEVLKETRWRLGTVYNTNNVSTNFYYEPILNCIQDIVSLFDLELTFTVAITGNKIVKRQVNMYSQQGERTGKRFEYGSNALEVEQETSTDELYTALVGRGKGEEVEGDHSDGSPTGYGRRITFADVVWKKSNGDALDKPKGQEYLEDPEATKLYGFADGSPRIGIVTFEDDTDKRLLLNHTYEKLLELERPQVRFKASVLDVGDLGLGDTVAIIRHDFHIEYFTRVFKVDHDLLDKNNNTIELGDDLSGNDIGSQVNDISNSISSMHQQISYVMAGASSDNQKVTYSPDQPADGSLGDLWYKDLGNGQTEMYIYNDGWQLVVDSSGTNQEVLDKVDQAMQDMADKEKEINDKLELNQIDISQAQADIEQDRQDAANSIADIRSQVAKDMADAKAQSKQALDTANSVDDKATEALTNAEQALGKAQQAITDIASGKTDITDLQAKVNGINTNLDIVSSGLDSAKDDLDKVANQAKANGGSIVLVNKDVSGLKTDVADTKGDVSQVIQQAQELSTAITNAKGNISKLQQTATSLASTIKDNAGDITSLKQTATSLSSDMKDAKGNISSLQQTATGLSSTVGDLQSDLSDTNKTVTSQGTQITQNKKDITSKADKTTVDDLTKTVSSNSTSITQNAKDIKTKANSSTVNTLAGKMTDAETSISQNATDIKSKADKSTVDTINQTVSDQGTKITQNANDIKSKASSSDVNKLKGTVETNETLLLQTAQGLTGKADTTQLNKLSGDLTTLSNNFSTTSSGFQASLSKIDDKVNNIQIGGRNLLLDTTNQRNTDYWQATNSNTDTTKFYNGSNITVRSIAWSNVRYRLSNLVERGVVNTTDYFTFSMLVKGDDDFEAAPNTAIRFFCSVANSNPDVTKDVATFVSKTEWKQLSATFKFKSLETVTDNGYDESIRFELLKNLTKGNILFTQPTLVRGNKTTDWKPAPEDTDSAIADTNKQLSVAKADIKATADNLSTNYTKTTDEHNYVNSQIKQSADKINLSVASVSDKIDANQTDTDSKIAALQIVDDQIKSTVASKVSSSDVQGILDKGGYATQTWTGSQIDQKANEISSTVTEVSNKVDNLEIGGRNLIITSQLVNGWIDDLGKATGGGDNPFTTGIIDTGSNQDIIITKAGKVIIIGEYDTDKKFITKNRIENPDMYYQFKTGKETEYIRVTFGFDKKDYGAPYKVEKGNKATDWTPAPEDLATVTALSKVDQKADSISTTVTNNKTDADTKFTNVNQTISGIQSTVANKADASQITQLSNQINLKVNTSDYNTAMGKKADKASLVSQINIDKSGVLIQGKKIMIDGDTYIKNGVIKSAMIDTLDANKITTGTLNAANVNIINMNVDKLVGNKSNFVQSAWNGISDYVTINSGGIDVGAGNAIVSLKSNGMHIYSDYNGEDIGLIAGNNIRGYPSVNGLNFELNPSAEYMAWSERRNNTGDYSVKMLYMKEPQAGYAKGFNFYANTKFNYDVTFNGKIATTNSSKLYIDDVRNAANGNHYAGLMNEARTEGFLTGVGGGLYLLYNNTIYSLKGVKLPTGISNDGTVARYLNIV